MTGPLKPMQSLVAYSSWLSIPRMMEYGFVEMLIWGYVPVLDLQKNSELLAGSKKYNHISGTSIPVPSIESTLLASFQTFPCHFLTRPVVDRIVFH